MQRALDRCLERETFDIIQIAYPVIGYFTFRSDAVRILDASNVEYDVHRRVAERTQSPVRKWWSNYEYRKLYQQEGAIRHGYTDATFGCPVIVADGFSGEDDYRVELPEGLILKETYIGRAVAEADAMIVIGHSRGHSITMYGGVLKQLGIGCQSKRGKYITHLAHWGDPHDAIGWPKFTDKCPGTACKFHKMCDDSCPHEAHKVMAHGKEWHP